MQHALGFGGHTVDINQQIHKRAIDDRFLHHAAQSQRFILKAFQLLFKGFH
jgi:hypothetical protein